MPAAVGDFFSWFGVGLPAFLFVITLVVFFHELGHFVVARWCGVKVDTFSIGFGREIIGFTDRKGTRWKLSWIPLGGYVKFFGDADVTSRPDRQVLKDAETHLLRNTDPREGTLHVKPLYQRALVAAAGPFANFILAIIIFTGLIMSIGKPAEPPIIDQVMASSAAETAGLLRGDTIRSVDGQTIHVFADLQRIVGANAGKTLHVVVTREGREVGLDATPTLNEVTDASGAKHSVGRLGIMQAMVPVGIFDALKGGVEQTWLILHETLSYLGKIVTGQEGPDQLHGILGIGAVSDQAARIGFGALLSLAGLMSVSIGLVNLLPIPVLDGGHLLYYACEAVLGRPLGERAQEVGFRLGLAFVLCLFLLATFNDLVHFNLF
jgi:regulator of sigma E protease